MLFCAVYVFAGEHTIFRGKCSEYSDSENYQIRYDDKEDIFYFFFSSSSDWSNSINWIHLNRNDLAKLRNIISKYFEWEETAVKNKVMIEKEIPDSRMEQNITWKAGDEWYFANGLTLTFTFSSQTETRHRLVLSSNKVQSTNLLGLFRIKGCYFGKDEAKALYDGISENNITKELDAVKEKVKKKEETESLFK
jgi:hypothetical protein